MPDKSLASVIIPGGIVLASAALGLFLQKVVLARLGRAAKKSAAVWDDVLIKSLKGVIFIWVLLAGAEGALKYLRLRPSADRLLTQAITILAILSVTYFAARLASGYVNLGLGRVAGFPVSFLRNLTWLAVGGLGVLMVLDYLKVRLTPLLTALGVGGLAVSLALQDTLSNLFAGLHILATRKVSPAIMSNSSPARRATSGTSPGGTRPSRPWPGTSSSSRTASWPRGS